MSGQFTAVYIVFLYVLLMFNKWRLKTSTHPTLSLFPVTMEIEGDVWDSAQT